METTFSRKIIITNVLTLFTGTSIAQLLTGITMILTARQLGPAAYGQYAGTIVLATFISIFFNLGLDVILLKNAGRMPGRLQIQLGSAITIKLVLGTAWFLAIYFLASSIDSESFPTSLLRLAALLIWSQGLFTTLLTAFKASLKNQYTFLLFAGSDLAWFLLTLYLIYTNETNVDIYMQARLYSMILSVLVAGGLVWRIFHPKTDRPTTVGLLRESPPYAASEFLSMLFARADVLIISLALTQIAVGLYSPSISIITTFYLLNNAIYGVMLPILSYQFVNNINQAWKTARRMVLLQAAIGGIVFLFVALGAGYIVLLLGDKYAGSIDVIRILSINIFLHAINFGFIAIIIATNQQPKATRLQAAAVAINIILNLFIVSQFGINGVAVVYVITELFLLAGYALVVAQQRTKTSQSISVTNILLINGHSFLNAGDAALISVATDQLETAFPNSHVTCIMNDPASHPKPSQLIESLTGWIRPGGVWNIFRLAWSLPATIVPALSYRFFGKPWLGLTPRYIRKLVTSYTASDIVVSIPGGFVYSSGRGIALLLTFFSWGLAFLAGKPLYILPQSIGPLQHAWERRLLRFFLNKTQIVMVREQKSIKQLQVCRVNTKQMLIPDLAFGFQSAPAKDAMLWFSSKDIELNSDRPLLGVTVIDWGAQNPGFTQQSAYELAVIEVVRHFIHKHHGKVVFLPQCIGPTSGEDDRLVAHRIAGRMKDLGNSVITVEQQPSPDLLKSICGCFDLFIGTRMHSNIFALSHAVPVIAIGYLHKTEGIAQMAGIADWVIDIRQINQQLLIQKIDLLWERREDVRSQLNQVIPELIRASCTAGSLIAEDIRISRLNNPNG